jgi:hypothetical protein
MSVHSQIPLLPQSHCEKSGPLHWVPIGAHGAPGVIESGGGQEGGGGQSGIGQSNVVPLHVHIVGSVVQPDCTIDSHCKPFSEHDEPGYVSCEHVGMTQTPGSAHWNAPSLHVHVSVDAVPQFVVANWHVFPS